MSTRLVHNVNLKRLAKASGLLPMQCIGLLHALWEYAAEKCRDGVIVREDVRNVLTELDSEASGFDIEIALYQTGWLVLADPSDIEVGYLHDWHEHAPDHVHRSLARRCLKFGNGALPRLAGLTKEEKCKAELAYGIERSKPQPSRKRVDSPSASERPEGKRIGGRVVSVKELLG